MNSPVFSVLIPSFNRAAYLERAIESVINQKFDAWELIVVDDGSTDHTQALLEGYLNHPKIKTTKTSNQGVSKARNVAASFARGEWLAFLDSDDEWLPRKLLAQWEHIQSDPDVKLVHSEEIWIRNGVRINQKKKYKKNGGDQFEPSLGLCAISPSTAAIRKDVFEELGGFREDFPVCEDYDLWLKFTSLYPVGLVDEPLIKKYGGHGDQLSFKYQAMDHWRVKSMGWILENRNLSASKKEALLTVLKKKLEILIQGHEKRGNIELMRELAKMKALFFQDNL